jgi:hypothetical protein
MTGGSSVLTQAPSEEVKGGYSPMTGQIIRQESARSLSSEKMAGPG